MRAADHSTGITMDLRWEIFPLFLCLLILTMIVTVQGSPTNTLLNDLKYLNMNRHHVTNPDGKDKARDYIRNTLTSLGLHTWTEQFKLKPEYQYTGTNIVGVLPGKQYKSIRDRLVLIGAHYDTTRDTNGVDDNASGVVAMLQVARLLTKTSSSCSREYSVMFVAFDFEEWEESTLPGWACEELGCGSRAFVANFSHYYNLFPKMYVARYGQLQGAIIMDTMMNFDSTPNSQTVPPELAGIFPKQYESIVQNQKKGDFLLVTGRFTEDMNLLSIFKFCYNTKDREQGNQYKLQVFPLPFEGQTNNIPEKYRLSLKPFLRSDHVSFWNEVTSNRAIFLTDTGNMRSYMKECYHHKCDDLKHVTKDFLEFLSKSCDIIVSTTNYITRTDCKANAPDKDITALESGFIGMGATLFAALTAVVAWVCFRRRKEEDENVLVVNDQLQEGKTDVPAQAGTYEQQPSEA